MIEHLAPQDWSPPLHVHRREDEWFYVLEGKLIFWIDGRVIAAAGRIVCLRAAQYPAHIGGRVAHGTVSGRRGTSRI